VRHLLFIGVLALAAIVPAVGRPAEGQAQSVIICPTWSFGGAYGYGSATSCPIPAAIATSSWLNQFDPYFNEYYNRSSTYSGCSSCYYDAAFTSYTTGPGEFQVVGYHYASAPGYYPGFGYSFYYYTV
jgi:hypothetical protein